MVAGVIRLSAPGKEDMYLSYRPQITFFKSVFKRYTFFAQETIDQSFTSSPNFGGKYSCIIAPQGDLLVDVMLRLVLPAVPTISDSVLVRWVDSVACALIKKVEFEVNGTVVDSITGEWIRVYLELIGHKKYPDMRGSHYRGLMEMTGGRLERFQSSMSSRTLYLPLPFWFTRANGQAFPVASINTREVRLNVELNSIASVLQYAPTHSIRILEDELFFVEGDLLLQGSVNDERGTDARAMGVFIRFDSQTRTMFYNVVLGSFVDVSSVSAAERFIAPAQYLIRNKAGFFCTPSADPVDLGSDLSWFLSQRFSLSEMVVQARYVLLGSQEKRFFDRRRHEYVIEQLQVYSLSGLSRKNNVKLVIRRPCSEIIWVSQMTASAWAFGLPFNYTDVPDGSGKPLILSSEVLLNTESLFEDPTGKFFSDLQTLLHHPTSTTRMPGIQLYSFALFPDEAQPSGSVNMSKIEKAYLQFQVSSFPVDSITMRVFARTSNVLVIQNGIGELLF